MINLVMICQRRLRSVFYNYSSKLKMSNAHVMETINIIVNIIKLHRFTIIRKILSNLNQPRKQLNKTQIEKIPKVPHKIY